MNRFSRLCAHAWIVTLLGALAVIGHIAALHLAQVERLSNLAGGDAIVADPASPTGYAGGLRKLVLPELSFETLGAVVQTQRMLASDEWRIRQVDSDNAPIGRPTYAPSPFRWWLGAVAWADSQITGRPLGQSVERAAVLAGPVLLVVLILGATLFVLRFFGRLAAGLLPLALAFAYPFAGNLLSPLAGARLLTQVLLVGALLPLAAAVVGERTARGRRSLFMVGGVFGGLALWLDVGMTGPVLLGVAAGGLLVAWRQRGRSPGARAFAVAELPWRWWAVAGAATSLLAYFAEYAPAHLLGWRLEWNHPLYALAWLGVGELVVCATAWISEGRRVGGARAWLAIGGAVVAVLAAPGAALLLDSGVRIGIGGDASRMTLWPRTGGAAEILAWVFDAQGLAVCAVLLPLLLLIPAGWAIWSRRDRPRGDAAVLVATPVLPVLVLAGWSLSLWAAVDAVLLVVLAALTAGVAAQTRRTALAWTAAVVLVLLPAGLKVQSEAGGEGGDAVSDTEFEALLYRDLAHWMVGRVPEGGAIVLAPPVATGALYFYGGVRGIVTADPENRDGFAAAVRLCSTTSSDEGEALARKRELTHLVLPSWDPLLEEFARIGNGRLDRTLVSLVKDWLPPRWLRPVPYVVPQPDAASNRSVAVFEMTDVQDQALALARMGEYFAELGREREAAMVAASLGDAFADDLNSLIARGVIAAARRDGAQVKRVVGELQPVLERGDEVDLPWDRRVALAVFLAQVRQPELAKPRLAECLASIDETRLRQMSTMTLFRVQMIAKAYGLAIEDATLRELALRLLPAEMRARLQ